MRALRTLLLAVAVTLGAACDGPEGHWRHVPTAATDPELVPRTLPSDLTNEPTPDQVLAAFAGLLWGPTASSCWSRWRGGARARALPAGRPPWQLNASRALHDCARRGGCRAVPVLVAPGGLTAALGW